MFIFVIREKEVLISMIRDSLFFLFVNRATDLPCTTLYSIVWYILISDIICHRVINNDIMKIYIIMIQYSAIPWQQIKANCNQMSQFTTTLGTITIISYDNDVLTFDIHYVTDIHDSLMLSQGLTAEYPAT